MSGHSYLLWRTLNLNFVDGTALNQKDVVKNNKYRLKNDADILVLLFCDVQLILRSGIFTAPELSVHVSIMLKCGKNFW